jgi:hypothetical protein
VLPVEEGVAFHDALDIEQPVAARVGVRKACADLVAVDGAIDNDLADIPSRSCSASFNGMTGLASRCILGSWDLQPLRTTRLPSLQDNMSSAGGTLLGFSQWEGEKKGRPFGCTRRMNAAT